MKILVNYADDTYKQSQLFCNKMGKIRGGFDQIFSFGPQDIEEKYFQAHSDIFNEKRGNGLWLWKPYFIKRVLEETADGDYVFYCDSGAFFLKKVDYIIQSLRPGEKIWVSDNPLIESCFTKQKCFDAMKCNENSYKYSNQIQATYLMFVNCLEARHFVNRWLSYCENYDLLSPEGTICDLSKNYGLEFVAHREDQSILSLLCKKNGIKPHLDPSQRAFFPETYFNPYYAFKMPEHSDSYGCVIFLHKAKSVNLFEILKVLVGSWKKKKEYQKWEKR